VQLNRDTHLPALATSVNNLAIHPGPRAGRRAAALATAQEAAVLYRELAAAHPDVFDHAAADTDALVADLTSDEP